MAGESGLSVFRERGRMTPTQLTRDNRMPELFHVLTIAQALDRLLPRIARLDRAERVAIVDALDRVTATELRSPVDLPAFARSTMDGFAVRAADTYGASEGLPAYLTLCGEVPMGRAPEVEVRPEQAARVHTGGMIPPGADAVVMVENTQALDERTIEVVRPVAHGENIIPIGEDVRSGERLFPSGHRLRPQDVGGLAGVGITEVAVAARPRVAILATGDEVVPPDRPVAAGQIRDVNSYTIAAQTRRAGGEPVSSSCSRSSKATQHPESRWRPYPAPPPRPPPPARSGPSSGKPCVAATAT